MGQSQDVDMAEHFSHQQAASQLHPQEPSPMRPQTSKELLLARADPVYNKEYLQLSVEQYRQVSFQYSTTSAHRHDSALKGGAATEFVKQNSRIASIDNSEDRDQHQSIQAWNLHEATVPESAWAPMSS
jgi:hypothetical protein